MDVEHEIVGGAVWVGNVEQVRASFGGQSGGRGVGAAGHEDHVVRGDGTDGSHSGLDSVGPGTDCEVMRLVHDAKDDVCVVGVLGCQRSPEGSELVVCGPRGGLADDVAVPSGVVVNVNDAFGSGVGQAA